MGTKEYDESNEFNIYDVRIIKLQRYNYSKEYGPASINNGYKNKFYLFDFFDCLSHMKDNGDLVYEDCMGLDKTALSKEGGVPGKEKESVPPNNILASQLWTLVRTQDDCINDEQDPFLYVKKENKEYLSDRPFLAVITVNINPKHYIYYLNNNETTNETKFINKCIDYIREKISSALSIYEDDAIKPLTRIFVSMNYGDFCVAVRSSNMNDANMILSELRKPSKIDNTYSISFSTFTTMGIETGVNYNVPSAIDPKKIDHETDYYISLRLSVDSSIINIFKEIIDNQNCKKNKYNSISIIDDQNNKEIKDIPYGLFGRYEVSVKFSLAQFNKLYPLLCCYKLDIGVMKKIPVLKAPVGKAQSKITKEELFSLRILEAIDTGIRDKLIHIINERPLLKELYNQNGEGNVCNEQPNEQTDVWKKNEEYISKFGDARKILYGKIDSLSNRAYELPIKRKMFSESMRLVKGLFKTYTSLSFQYDSRINIWFLFALLYSLISLIEKYMGVISELMKTRDYNKMEHAKELCENLIASMIPTIECINSFAKSLQSRNIQTIYSPNYEIESQVDLEKYIIAFTEFLRIFIFKFYTNYKIESEYKPRRFITITTMDFNAQEVMALPLFQKINLPYYKKEENEKVPLKLIPILIPTFECLIRFYDLLPLLCHETSHYFRFFPRNERNEFFIYMLLKRSSKYVSNRWIAVNRLSHNYIAINSLERIVSESVFDAIKEYCPIKEWENYSMDQLLISVKDYLNSYLFRSNRDFSLMISQKDALTEALHFLFCKAQGLYTDPDFKKSVASYNELIICFDEDTTVVLPENIAEKLMNYAEIHTVLAKYRKSLSTKLISICDLNFFLQFLGCNDNKLVKELNIVLKSLDLIINESTISAKRDKVYNVLTDLNRYASANCTYQLRSYFLSSEYSPVKILDSSSQKVSKENADKIREIINGLNIDVASICNLPIILPDNCSDEFENIIKLKCENFSKKIDDYLRRDFSFLTSLATSFYNSMNVMKDKVKEYVQSLCDINYQFQSGNQILRECPKGIPVCSNNIRNDIILSIKENLSMKLSQTIKKDEPDSIMLTSSQIYPFLSSLCALSEDNNNFIENINKCILTIGPQEAKKIIDSCLEYYREITADLGMCAAVGFNALGYLKFSIRYYHRELKLSQDKTGDSFSDRVTAVLDALIDGKEAYDHFFKEIKKYIEETLETTRDDIFSDINEFYKTDINECFEKAKSKYKSEIKKNKQILADILNSINSKEADAQSTELSEEDILLLYSRFIENFNSIFSSCLNEGNRNILINKYYERFDRIIVTLIILRRIYPVLNHDIDEKVRKHFKKLYSNIKDNKFTTKFEDVEDASFARKAVGDYFNMTYKDFFNMTKDHFTKEIKKKTGDEKIYDKKTDSIKMANGMLKTTLSFTLKYYYRNRLNLCNNPTFDDKWIERLTGGVID